MGKYGLLVLALVAVVSAQDVCEKKYKKLGCFQEDEIGDHLFNDRSSLIWDKKKLPAILEGLVCKCEKAAKAKGYGFFAIRFWGECVGLTKAGHRWRLGSDACKDGTFKDCDDNDDSACVGKGMADYAYQIGRDGGYGPWGDYSPCSTTCGAGTQQRLRKCDNPTTIPNGNDCDLLGPAMETRACKVAVCPVDGKFGDWSDFESCSATCGGGSQSRSRKCDSPAPSDGGKDCVGATTETKDCGTNSCPVDGKFGDWSAFESCSATCGGGSQSRSRKCDSPAPAHGGNDCVGATMETQTCGTNACPVDGKFGDWSDFESCSATCGGGSQSRSRKCDSPAPAHGGDDCVGATTESQDCGTKSCPVDGKFGDWSAFDSCSASCGGGSQSRSRKCDSPAPAHGGNECVGATMETQTCGTDACPVDGGFGKWSDFGKCSADCGMGSQSRTRKCDSPSPVGTGKDCVGPTSESRGCNSGDCAVDGNWGAWGAFSDCSKTCDEGERSKYRQCDSPAPKGTGKDCAGDAALVEKCIKAYCISPSGVAKVQEMIEKYLVDWYTKEYPGKKPSGKFYKSIFDIQKTASEEFVAVGPKHSPEERLKHIEEYLKAAAEGGSIDFARKLFGKGLFHYMEKKIEEGLPKPDIDEAAEKYIKSLKEKIGEEKWYQILSSQDDATLMFTMDTTGSMADEIKASKAIAKSIIDATRDFQVDYILSPFNDPGSGPVTYKSDKDRAGFITDIDNLRARGGGDCPELAFKGMLGALDNGPKYGSPMFVFTDATAKDGTPENMAALKAAADLNSASITFFTNLAGCKGGSKQGIKEYQEIASYTSGQVFPLKNEAELLKFKDFVASSLSKDTMITSGGSLKSSSRKRSTTGRYTFPIDDGIKKLIISVATSVANTAAQVQLYQPSGAQVSAKNTMSQSRIFEVNDPSPGVYALNFPSSTGKHEYSVEGISKDAIAFAHNFMYQEAPSRNSPPFSLYDPIQGRENMLIVRLGGIHRVDMATTSVDIVDESGTVLQGKLKLDSLASDEVFKAKLTPPSVPFKVKFSGKTKSGSAFSRISRGTSRPSTVFMRPLYLGDEFTVKIGSNSESTQIQVLNFGSPATFHFVGKAQLGTMTNGVKNIRRSGFVQLTYTSPSSGKKGSTDRISITSLDTSTGKRYTTIFTVLLV